MVRARHWIASAVVGTVCLASTACERKTTGTAEGSTAAPPAVSTPIDIGAPLFKPAPMPKLEASIPQADPVVIHPAVVQYDLKVQIPAQVDGLIELIATPVHGPVNPADPLIVFHPRDVDKKQPYRRLRENDRVERGQTLVRLDEQLVARSMDMNEKIIEACGRAIAQGNVALDSYKTKLLQLEDLRKKSGAVATMEVEEVRATVARLWESVIQSEKEKAKSEGEMLQAQTQLTRYWCRSPVNGRVVKLLKSPGEFAKAGETILEIQSTDRVRVEGKLPAEYASLIKKDMVAIIEPTLPIGPAPFANWHRQEVTSVAVTAHPGRPLVVSGGADATALVWDVTGSKQSFRLPHPTGVGVRAVAYAKVDAKPNLLHWIATGADDGKIRLWDVSNPDKIPTTPTAELEEPHGAAVAAAAFSPDGAFLATAAGRDVFVWDVATKKKKYALPAEHRDSVTEVRFTPQSHLVTVSRDRTIRVWNLGEKGAVPMDPLIDHRSGAVDVLGVSADGSKVLFDKDAGRLDLVSLVDGRTVGTVQNPSGARFAGLALFSPTDKLILTAGGDADVRGELQLWDAPASGGRASERWRLVTPGRAAVTCAAFSPDPAHPFMVVGTQYGGVHYWTRTMAGEPGRRWVGKVESVLPADARSVQVRVVMENPGEVGGETLQDRSTATIIINPNGPAPIAVSRAVAAPAPRAVGEPANVITPVAGMETTPMVVPAVATVPTSISLPTAGVSAPVSSQPIPSAPIASSPLPSAPIVSAPTAGIYSPTPIVGVPLPPISVPGK